jgi:hypothetical protein
VPHAPWTWPLTFYFDLFIIFLVFSTQIHNFERSFSLPSGPKAVLFRLAIFLLEALLPVHHYSSFFTTYNTMEKKYHTVGKVSKSQ